MDLGSHPAHLLIGLVYWWRSGTFRFHSNFLGPFILNLPRWPVGELHSHKYWREGIGSMILLENGCSDRFVVVALIVVL